MHNDKTIKELKQILDEHNCAIPNGAKKKDLVELVEAIMAKDEDFVTMQITDPTISKDDLSDFNEVFEVEQKEEVVEEKKPAPKKRRKRKTTKKETESVSE